MKKILLTIGLLAIATQASADLILFSQDTFPASGGIVADGWTVSLNTRVNGRNDADLQNALTLGWSGQVEFAQKSSGVNVTTGETYFFQFDARLSQTFGDTSTWVNNAPNDRDLTWSLRNAGGTDLITPVVTTINAVTSQTQWTTVRGEFTAVDLGVGEVLSFRFDKANFGGGEEAVWIDNIQLGTVAVPEPATFGLLALGGLALLRRRFRN